MSLDNVLAVAGAARDHPYIMIFGLVLSIALMAVAAQLIARLIDRHRWIAYVGLVIVLLVAVKMIYEGGLEVLQRVNGRGLTPGGGTGHRSVIGSRQAAARIPAAWTASPTNGRNRSKFSSNRAASSARRRVVGRPVGPGRARVEQVRVHARRRPGHAQPEHGMDRHRHAAPACRPAPRAAGRGWP